MARQAWSIQEELKNQHLMSETELTNKILSIKGLQEKAFCAALYILMARLGELIPYTYTGKYFDIIKYTERGLALMDFRMDGLDMMEVIVRCEKSGKVKNKFLRSMNDSLESKSIFLKEKFKSLKHRTRLVPIPCEEGTNTRKLLQVIDEYMDIVIPRNHLGIQDKVKSIFEFGEKKAYKIVRKNLEMNPHMLRHYRAYHYVKEYGLNVAELQRVGGWASTQMPSEYILSDILDIKTKLRVAEQRNKIDINSIQNIPDDIIEEEEQKGEQVFPLFEEDKLKEDNLTINEEKEMR